MKEQKVKLVWTFCWLHFSCALEEQVYICGTDVIGAQWWIFPILVFSPPLSAARTVINRLSLRATTVINIEPSAEMCCRRSEHSHNRSRWAENPLICTIEGEIWPSRTPSALNMDLSQHPTVRWSSPATNCARRKLHPGYIRCAGDLII